MSTTKKVSKTTQKFLALTKPEQRVVIAKDIIAQLDSKFIKAKRQTYVDLNLKSGTNEFLDVQANLDKVKNCTACAVGSMMICITKFANTLNFHQLEEMSWDHDALKLLKKIFPPNQLKLIEYSFEGSDMYAKSLAENKMNVSSLTSVEKKKIDLFRKGVKGGAEGMLKKIMENVITNSGKFKP